jgi:FkbM family methyltransferase
MTEAIISSALVGRIHCDPRSRMEVEFIVEEIFEREEYLRHGIALAPGMTVIDAGANIGLFSLWADRKCGGRCAIYAFEPVRSTFEKLELNAKEHGLSLRPEVKLFNQGLTRVGGPEQATITVYDGLPGNATLHPEDKSDELDRYLGSALEAMKTRDPSTFDLFGEIFRRRFDEARTSRTERCALTSIARLAREQSIARIDLLKIDVEGAELDVIAGIDDTTWALIGQVVIETEGAERAQALTRAIESRGFLVVAEKPDWASKMGLGNYNVFCTR